MLVYNYCLNSCKQHTGQRETRRNYMHTESQEDTRNINIDQDIEVELYNESSDKDNDNRDLDCVYTAQNQRIDNRVNLE